jgi:TATA-binding protein-associated factor
MANTEITGANAKAFRDMATPVDIAELQGIYQEYFQHDDADVDQPGLESTDSISISLGDVTTGDLGMEVEQGLNPEQLAVRLGLKNKMLPLEFNPCRYAVGSATLWSNPASVDAEGKTLVPLTLHWHQMAGLHSIIRNIFSNKPDTAAQCSGVLISDEVGLGKTGLAIAVIAFLNQIISIQERSEQLPPLLGKDPSPLPMHLLTFFFLS